MHVCQMLSSRSSFIVYQKFSLCSIELTGSNYQNGFETTVGILSVYVHPPGRKRVVGQLPLVEYSILFAKL